jgi:DNA-binding LacI/PurR family transcriptional regulator
MPLSPDDYEGPAGPERQAAARYYCNRERLAGMRDALQAAGIDWDDVRIEERAPHGRDAGRRAAAALLAGPDRPTALLAMSDELAIGALQAAEAADIAVPRDLSIIGFDDTPAACDARPPLSTIAQPHRRKGETAVRMLLDPDAQPSRVVLPTSLVARDSTAPPGR